MLTREDILKMEPGIGLDTLVAVEVMGWKNNWKPFFPSADISAAYEAESKAIEANEQIWATSVTTVLGIDNWILSAENIKRIAHMSAAERCKAALLAVMEESP